MLIGFERLHRIGRFPRSATGEVQVPSGYLKLPADAKRMRDQPGHRRPRGAAGGPLQGLDGGFRGAADARQRLSHRLDLDGNGEPKSFQLQDIDGFNITDAAGLADGGLLVLERYFRWIEGVKMRTAPSRGGRDRARRAHRQAAR